MRDNRRPNKTFNIGNGRYNACVGQNGIQDITKYERGYDQAAKEMISAVKNHKNLYTVLDSIIYPIIYCARHRIELFLKKHLSNFKKIRPEKQPEIDLLNTGHHKIGELWNEFKSIGATIDKRLLEFIQKADEYISDYVDVDPDGQVFRYPNDIDNNEFLNDISVINLEIFEGRYHQLSELMGEFNFLVDKLVAEYKRTGTFTKTLSRKELKEISKALPVKENWRDESFIEVKEKIKSQYELSNSKFSKALDIIKSHREFSLNIGVEIVIDYISPEKLILFTEYHKKLHKNYGLKSTKVLDNFLEETKRDAKILQQVLSDFSCKEIACLRTFWEVGKFKDYGESFDWLFEDFQLELKHEDNFQDAILLLMDNVFSVEHIKRGLNNTGQRSLLLSIEPPF